MTRNTGDSKPNRNAPHRNNYVRQVAAMGVVLSLFSVLAIVAPIFAVDVQARVGLLLLLTATIEIAHGYRRSTGEGQRAAWYSATTTLVMGFVLVGAPLLATTAILLFLAGFFAIDGIRSLAIAAGRARKGESFSLWILGGVGNLVAAGLLLTLRHVAADWSVAIVGAIRMLWTASTIRYWPVFSSVDSGETVVQDLGLPENSELQEIARRIAVEESERESIDRGWIIGFLATLFAIHVGRMGFDRTFLGIVSPGVAVLGDVAFALLLAFAVVIPCRVLWHRLTRWPERWSWDWLLAASTADRGWVRRFVQAVLNQRIRSKIRLRQARYSIRAALSRGLQIGLPLAAIIAATVPIWGMSWYFDTENWAAGMWNSWAEQRTDAWREAMVEAVWKNETAKGPAAAFAIEPAGTTGDADFSFLVIGDTGEGDASQHSLRATWLDVVRREDVKFVVVSSDVVYPTGAMRHYETNFWLPFMGTTKPVYAIPGNHDWYDALEAFVATFYEPDAARAALRARVEADNRITSTTDKRIDELIARATMLGREYRVPVQRQRAPFFQFQTDGFALFAIDTGVLKRVDPLQLEWLTNALGSAKGKVKMAIVGHPFLAGGRDLMEGDPEFAKIHGLLRKHEVTIFMAGDTHDLEHYTRRAEGTSSALHYVVNGGGGAYLSFGTALDWPSTPQSQDWEFYPSKSQVRSKIQATTPLWKRPAWEWTNRFGAWPFSAEWLSAAFDANVAPFYQSFVEVRVEPSQGLVRMIPYGVHGRLRWIDMERSPSSIPVGETTESLVEWVVPIGKNR